MIIINKVIPNVWSTLLNHAPGTDTKSKKDSTEGVIFLSQVASLVILCNWVPASPEVLVQVQQVVLTSTQMPPAWLKDKEAFMTPGKSLLPWQFKFQEVTSEVSQFVDS